MAYAIIFMLGAWFAVFAIALARAGSCEDCAMYRAAEKVKDTEGADTQWPARVKARARAEEESDILDEYAAVYDNMYDRE